MDVDVEHTLWHMAGEGGVKRRDAPPFNNTLQSLIFNVYLDYTSPLSNTNLEIQNCMTIDINVIMHNLYLRTMTITLLEIINVINNILFKGIF